jgi:site-specific recombinase XerD
MGEKTLRKALGDYRTIYMAYRNFAERTREEYLNDLQDFIRFLERSGIENVREIGLPIVERYIVHLEQNGYASLTRKRKVVTIRSFLSFLYQDGYIDTNIAKMVILPFTESTTPQILTQAECNRLREACAGSQRDKAIVELLLQTGIKLSELTRLTIDDVEFESINEKVNGYIRVVGSRSKKDRLIPLHIAASQALHGYLAIRETYANNTLFLNRFGEPLGERGVQKMLKKYFKPAGIGKAGVHTLRHTFGAHQIAWGKGIKIVQEAMGHKDLRSTSKYLSLAENLMKL